MNVQALTAEKARPLWITAAGTAVAVVASLLPVPLLPGVNFYFSGVFYLAIAILFGPVQGALAAAVSLLGPCHTEGHSYPLLLGVLEAVTVGALCRSRWRLWCPVSAGIYWALIGTPLAAGILYGLLNYGGQTAATLVIRLGINGLLNAVLADFLTTVPALLLLNHFRNRRSRPLRVLVATGLVVMALAPVIPLTVLSATSAYRHDREYLEGQLQATARAAQTQLDEILGHHVDALTYLSAGEGPIQAKLDRHKGYHDAFSWLQFVDQNGRVTASSGDAPRQQDAALVQAALKGAIQRRGVAFSEAAVDPGGKLWYCGATPRYTRTGELTGFIVGRVELSSLARLERMLGNAQDGLLIVDDRNRVLYSNSMHHVAPLTALTETGLAGSSETREPNWRLGQTMKVPLRSTAASKANGWKTMMVRPPTELQYGVERHYVSLLGWLTISVLISFGLAPGIARRVVTPLERLVASLRRFDIGDTWEGPYADGGAPKELIQIQHHFSELSARLAESSMQTQRALSEKDRLNDELQVLANNLDSKVRERTRELSEATVRAEAASDAKSLFLASMSHEIRTPLNAIIGISDLLATHQLGAEEQSLIETVRTSARGLLALINDILDFSKIESGKLELDNVSFDPQDIAESVTSVVALAAHAKDVEIICSVAPDVPRSVYGDPDRLQQVLLNLASNAVKFTSKGEVTVSVSQLSRNEKTAELKFAVSDTGVGIKNEAKHRMFQPFSQADISTTRQFGGTGLGLVVSKKLTERMGGKIDFDSTEGRGSTFWCTFTFQVGDDAGHDLPTPHFGSPILIVDDNAAAGQALSADLAALGFDSVAVANSDDALAAMAGAERNAAPFGAVMLDYALTGTREKTPAELIRAAHPSVPLVFLRAQTQRLHDADTAGMEPYASVRKPLRRRKLLECLLDIGLIHTRACAPLPLEKQAPAYRRRPSSEGRRRILLVEDNPVNQRVATKMLDKLGFDCDLAQNGAEAVASVGKRPYNCVLMDCQMPVMDGFEATRQIRGLSNEASNVVIIAMTANAYSEDRQRCCEAGMDDYLAKPVALEALSTMLERWTAAEPVA